MKIFRSFPVNINRSEIFKEIPLAVSPPPIFYLKPSFNIKGINMKEDIYQQIKKMTEEARSRLARHITKNIHQGLKWDIATKKVLDKHFPESYL